MVQVPVKRILRSAEEMERFGEEAAKRVSPGVVLLLQGPLASGKTTFVRGLVRGLGGDPGEVCSPSFVLVNEYVCVGGPVRVVYHLDMYRLAEGGGRLREIGVEELVGEDEALLVVEWPKAPLEKLVYPAREVMSFRFSFCDEGRLVEEV